jgi:hypothetical protein
VSIVDATRREPEHGPLWTVLGVLILLTVFACAAGLLVGVPMYQQYPAKISVPDSVLGLTLIPGTTRSAGTDDHLDPAAQQYLRSFPTIGVYADEADSQEVLVWASTRFVTFPESELDQVISVFVQVTDEVGEIVEVPAGDLGGSTKCAYFRFSAWGKQRGVLCGWADHGSIGIVGLAPAEDRAEAARKFLDVRAAVESR